MKRFFTLLIAVIMCMSLAMPAFAAEKDRKSLQSKQDSIPAEWETIYVTLDDGRVVAIEISGDDCCEDGPATRSLSPEYPVGTTRTYYVKIRNAQLTTPYTVGSIITSTVKGEIAEIVAAALNSKLGTAAIAVSAVLALLGTINACVGNEGFMIRTTVEYRSHYISSQGYYLYAWSLTDLNLSVF